jgi:hypothetical protein
MSQYFTQIFLACDVIFVHVVLQIPNDKSEVDPKIFETTHRWKTIGSRKYSYIPIVKYEVNTAAPSSWKQ